MDSEKGSDRVVEKEPGSSRFYSLNFFLCRDTYQKIWDYSNKGLEFGRLNRVVSLTLSINLVSNVQTEKVLVVTKKFADTSSQFTR